MDKYIKKKYPTKKFANRKEKIAFLQKKGVKLQNDNDGILSVAISKGKQCISGKQYHTDRSAEEQFDNAQDNRFQGKCPRLSKPRKGLEGPQGPHPNVDAFLGAPFPGHTSTWILRYM